MAVLTVYCTASGCAGSSEAKPAAAPVSVTASDDPTNQGLVEHHRYHHHGGVMLLVAMSLDTLGVSAEQRAAVEKIRAHLHGHIEQSRLAEQSLSVALADGLVAASFDAPRIDAAVAQVEAAAAGVHQACAEALNELHGLLTPEQRAALVDKIESHWAVWQEANAEATEPKGTPHDYLVILTADLALTPEQVSKIRAGLVQKDGRKALDPAAVSAHLRAFDDAFRSEKFDARAIDQLNQANVHMAGRGAAHLARFVQIVSPTLTLDQRATYAQSLREHASHNPSAEVSP